LVCSIFKQSSMSRMWLSDGVFSTWKSVCALLCPLFRSIVLWCARNEGDWVKNTENALNPLRTGLPQQER
jgi:hypothetical protein